MIRIGHLKRFDFQFPPKKKKILSHIIDKDWPPPKMRPIISHQKFGLILVRQQKV